jgi:hypothetical protein
MLSKNQQIKIRNFFISNFFVNINCIIYNNTYIEVDNNYFLFYSLKIIPLFVYKIINYFINIKFIYSYDNIYNITGINKYKILPYIYNFVFYEVKMNTPFNKIVTNTEKNIYNASLNSNICMEQYDVSNNIKYYNSYIPLKFILLKNNIKSYNYLQIKYLNKNNFIEKKLFFKDNINKLIYDLFLN